MDSIQGTTARPASTATQATPRAATEATAAGNRRTRDDATGQLSESLRRISPGLRVSGSERLNSQSPERASLRSDIRELAWSVRDAGQGRSLAASGSRAMTDISTLLTRMRSLAVQAADGTLGDGERHDLDTRFRDLNDQIDQVIEVAEINGETPSGLRPFDGQSVSVGIHSSVVFGTAELERVEVNGTVANLGGSGAGAIEVGTLAGALNSLPVLDSAIAAAGSFVSAFEVFEDRVGLAIQAGRAAIADRVQAEDAIQDVDEAAERAELTRDAALSEPQAARRAHYDISPEAAMALLR